MIKYLYRHGRFHYEFHSRERPVGMHDLLDIYQLADKYDIPALRRSAGDKFFELAYRDLSTLSGTSGSTFIDCIARICFNSPTTQSRPELWNSARRTVFHFSRTSSFFSGIQKENCSRVKPRPPLAWDSVDIYSHRKVFSLKKLTPSQFTSL